jgi:hypothetical protein
MPGVYLVAQDTIIANATGVYLQNGYIQDAAGWNWTTGDLIYASTTAGRLLGSASIPSGSGDQVQIVGIATSANEIKFMPNLMLIEIE